MSAANSMSVRGLHGEVDTVPFGVAEESTVHQVGVEVADAHVGSGNSATDKRDSQQAKDNTCIWEGANEENITNYLLQEIDFLSLTTLDKDDLQVQTMPPAATNQEAGLKNALGSGTDYHSQHRGHGHELGRTSTPLCLPDPVFAFSSSYINTTPKDISLPDDFDLLSYTDSLQENLQTHEAPPTCSEAGQCQGNSRETISQDNVILTKTESPSDGMWTQIKVRDKEQKEIFFRDPGSFFQPKEPRRDVNEPRRPKNGFIRFSIKFRSEIAKKHPKLDNREISKMLGSRWRKMTAEEKKPYEEEFAKDIRRIRDSDPTWQYVPAKRSAEELVEPMPNRLRPREKLKHKIDKDWVFTSSVWSERDRTASAPKTSDTTWVQCDLCYQWRPLSSHIEMEDLPEKWYCYMNPDSRFNMCSPELLPERGDRPRPHLPSLFHMYPHPQPDVNSYSICYTSLP